MTMRLLGVVGAVAIAIALEPTSFGLTDPQAKLMGESIKDSTRASDVTDTTPAAPASTREASAADSTADPIVVPSAGAPATLSMVPNSPKLVRQLKTMLPKDLTVQQAAVGFRNQGQFVATAQVSHNVGIPFLLLKSKVVGEGMSLGQAIQTLRPDVNVSRELARVRELTAQ